MRSLRRLDALCILRCPGAASAFPNAFDLALDQAAVFLLQRIQPRKRGPNRDPLRIARVDARNERVDRVVENFGAEPAPDERGDRLLGVGWSGRDKGFAQ